MRARSFLPETEEEFHRIRAMLDRGLDAVLDEEAANGGKLPPPTPARASSSKGAGDTPATVPPAD